MEQVDFSVYSLIRVSFEMGFKRMLLIARLAEHIRPLSRKYIEFVGSVKEGK